MLERGLTITQAWRDADFCELSVAAFDGEYMGSTSVYASPDEPNALAAAIAGFPRSPDDSREHTLGNFNPRLAYGGVRMRFFCVGAAGHCFLDITIEAHEEVANALRSVRIVFPFDPGALDEFVAKLQMASAWDPAFLKMRVDR